METSSVLKKKLASLGIAALCFGYFAAYVPYSTMTKMITKGLFAGMNGVGLSGFALQPVALFANLCAMLAFITSMRWWKHATRSKILGISFPRPRWFTFISGICTGGVIVTTTLAYTFNGISIVFAMLLMRGGVLVMAPLVDTVARRRKRKIYWPSWVAALLSLGALVVAFAGKAGTAMTMLCAIDICLYLFCYFFRLLFMSNRAKSEDQAERKGYFVEEQLTAGPSILLGIIITGIIGSTMSSQSIPGIIWSGIVDVPFSGYLWHVFLIGVFSYGTGLFGSLIFLDRRENTFTVPANRIASIIAGVMATYFLAITYGQRFPSIEQLIGVGLVIAAIVFLAYRSVVEKRNAKAARGVPARAPQAEPASTQAAGLEAPCASPSAS